MFTNKKVEKKIVFDSTDSSEDKSDSSPSSDDEVEKLTAKNGNVNVSASHPTNLGNYKLQTTIAKPSASSTVKLTNPTKTFGNKNVAQNLNVAKNESIKNSKAVESQTDSSKDESDSTSSSPDDEIVPKKPTAAVNKTTNNGAVAAQPIKSNNFKALETSDSDDDADDTSGDKSDSTSSSDDEIATKKSLTEVKSSNNKGASVHQSTTPNNSKALETSDSDDVDSSEDDKTSSENDASDEEEEDESDEEEKEVKIKPKQDTNKSEATVVQPKNANFYFHDDDDGSDDDYSSSEDDVFVKKPTITTTARKPFENVDMDSSEHDDDSSDDEIPIKTSKETTVPAIIPISQQSKPPTRTTIPLQDPFNYSSTNASTVTPCSSKQLFQTVTTVTPGPFKQTPKVQAEDKQLLNALQEFKLNLADPISRQKELERRAEEALQRNELTFVCCVCFENFYRNENFGKCKNFGGQKTKVDHYICITCLRSSATPENAGIAADGSGLKCPFPECPNILMMSELRGMIDKGVESSLLELIGRMSLASANIGILVTCPKCQKQWILEDKTTPYYFCECKRKNCLSCEREYDKFHEGRNCHEAVVTANEFRTKQQNEVALELNNVVVRVCHKCGIQFVKSQGCNKMVCRCQATQCYICRERDIDYGHFGGACQLYDDAEAYDQRRLDEVLANNKNVNIKHL
jgi:hypothetical protein